MTPNPVQDNGCGNCPPFYWNSRGTSSKQTGPELSRRNWKKTCFIRQLHKL